MEERESRHARLRALDAAHVWHPFTQMQGWAEEDPLIVESGEGRHLIDDRGNRYLDGISALWCNVHGHRVPEIDQAIVDQLGRVAHTTLLGQASVASIELAARLAQIAPGDLQRVFFSDSGSTAVEVALKMAFQYWRHLGRPEKRLFVSLGEAYHGDTIGSVSLGAIDTFHKAFGPLLFERLEIPTPYTYRVPAGFTAASWIEHCLATAEELLAKRGHEIAALAIEPLMQGAAGMIAQPKGFLARIAAACRKHDVLLICDEVATGFGRTGTMFAVEQEGVVPDLLCMAKGITGGYLPLAATLASERIYEAFLGTFAEAKTFFHGHTYTGNPLACAAAIASLDLFEKNRLLERLQPKITYLTERLAGIAEHPHVGEIRQKGTMIGIELVQDRATKAAFPAERRMGHRVILQARRHGVILRPLGDVIVLMPPLAITDEELALLCDVTLRSIEEATAT
ncbi:adenosylmethionine--8-amino-7-oxononanoate transaminase [Vulgatibacter sp.]|uniref:adenosylmethionine--8-amino-7-oxononanoate transaminase n=1 Tax=Vulgatibacter sp. TaxID=1971226 RepID=UPI0035656DD6